MSFGDLSVNLMNYAKLRDFFEWAGIFFEILAGDLFRYFCHFLLTCCLQ